MSKFLLNINPIRTFGAPLSWRLRPSTAPQFRIAYTPIKQFSSTTLLFKQTSFNDGIKKAKETAKQNKAIWVHKSKEISNKLREPLKDIIPEHENIYTIPNMLTLTRLIAAPIIGYLIVTEHRTLAAGLFAYSCITDFVDGYIARKFNMGTVIGSIIDPMADKSLMMISTVCLAQASQMPVAIAAIILGRDVLLAMSAVYYRYVSLPPPKTFKRYWDFSIPSASVHPTTISKYNTGLQMVYIATIVGQPSILHLLSESQLEMLNLGITGFGYLVGTTTILSGLSYVFSKDAVKIISKSQSQK